MSIIFSTTNQLLKRNFDIFYKYFSRYFFLFWIYKTYITISRLGPMYENEYIEKAMPLKMRHQTPWRQSSQSLFLPFLSLYFVSISMNNRFRSQPTFRLSNLQVTLKVLNLSLNINMVFFYSYVNCNRLWTVHVGLKVDFYYSTKYDCCSWWYV